MSKQKTTPVEPSEPAASVTEPSETTAEQPAATSSELQKAVEQANAKATEHWEQLLRKEAELQNFQRRSQQELASSRKFAIEKFAEELLAVVDSLERGLAVEVAEQEPQALAILEGMELTHKVLLNALKKFEIKELNPQGEVFDPKFHEALAMHPTGEVLPNHVLNVVQKGYLVHERLLRPARVIVARPLEEPAASEK
jgi:molecular chaperone GrpE